MSGRTIVVTGGTRGIGRAIVERVAADGEIAVFTGRSAESVEKAMESAPEGAVGRACDVSDPAAVKEFFKWVTGEFGTLSVLVNNAGITRDGLVLQMKPAHWDAVMNTNLKGAYLCSQAALRPMMKNEDGGRIINISSVVGVMGNPGQANYVASKAGLIGLTKSIAKEYGSRTILVNAIAPGFIETDMTAELPEEAREKVIENIPLGRLGKAEEVAALCSFLAGPDASYITGQVFHVDGGMVM